MLGRKSCKYSKYYSLCKRRGNYVNFTDANELVDLTDMKNKKDFSKDENPQEEAIESINNITINMKAFRTLDDMWN